MMPRSCSKELLAKIKKYTELMWWQMTTTTQAAQLLCVAKENGKCIDVHQRNNNTIKDVTPLPDQDTIQMDVARAQY